MPFSDAANPNAFGESDPLVAGMVPLYDDRLEEDLLPQPGSSNPIDQPAFRDLSNLSPDELATVLGVTPVVDGDVSSIEIDADLVETPESEEVAIADDDLLTNADDEAISTQEDLTQSDFDEEVTVEEDLEETDDEISNTSETQEDAIADEVDATDHEISNTSETEEDAIADDVDVAVDPIPEIEPLPVLELTDSTPGIFTVGSDGTIRIDYNYDHGKFESEVAIVSTAGLENFLPTDDNFSQFNAEVSRRALSHSELGHIVIADATEGARFSSTKWGPNRNSGTYFGVKSFQMNPGDNYMVVMVPNRTFQETLEKSATHSSQRLLFSVSDFNPGEHVQFVQVAAGSADGNLFAFEDLRIDRNSDKSFNDIVLQMRGGEGPAPLLTNEIDTSQGFWSKDMGQALIEYGEPYLTPAPIDLPTVPAPIPDIAVPHDDAGLNTSVTRDDDTTEAGLETTVTRDDEVVSQDSSDTEEETVVVDAPTDTTSAESEEVEDTTSDDETVEASTGFAGVTTISTPPPERFDFPKAKQPLIGIIDTGLAANNPDIEYGNITSGTDRVDGDADPLLQPGEGSQHGTHVAGIISAKADNGFGIDGINPNAPLWIGRAIDSGKWSDSLIEFVHAAINSEQPNAVAYLGFDLTQINPNGTESTRFELTPQERGALEFARQNGILIVVPAGNQGGVMSVLGQASREFDNIIAVGAAENFDPTTSAWKGFDRVNYSSYGRGLDIVAPGGTVSGGILSTVGSGIGTMAGTSVAAAQVAGAASLIQAANPNLNYLQVKEILKLTATDLTVTGTDIETGAGLLNLDAAVKLAKVTQGEEYDPPDFLIPDTWSGEGKIKLIPDERAANFDYPITSVTFSGRVAPIGPPYDGVAYRYTPDFEDKVGEGIAAFRGTELQFDAWTWGEVGQDFWVGNDDALWYHVAGTDYWVPSVYIDVYPPGNPSLLPPEPTSGNSNFIYLSSRAAKLLEVDPFTGAQRRIDIDQYLNDVALSPEGRLYGANFWDLYEINVTTGEMRHIGEFPEDIDIDSLAFSPNGQLYGADETGNIFSIATDNAQLTQIGYLGGPSSGDLVFYNDSQFYATVGDRDMPTDLLVSGDVNTGQSHVLFDLGVDKVYGLAIVNGTLMGYSDAGNPMVIDPNAQTVEVQASIDTLDPVFGATAPLSFIPNDNNLIIVIGDYTIDGDIYRIWEPYQGTLGNPTENVQTHPSGATYQRFDNGSIVSSEHGTFPLYGGIRQEYLNNSGLDGWLGAPTSPEVPQGNGVIKQTFENGYIIWNGSHAIAYESPDVPVQPPPISNPMPISGTSLLGKKISLDPGHGITNLGFDPGASGNGTTEATENLVQANIIAEYLRQRGAEVTIVNEAISLTHIGQHGTGSDAFVSLHLNASELKNAQGHEVYADPTAPQADFDLANAINSELDLTFPDTEIPNRGVKTQILAVLRGVPTSVPAALTEALFIDAPGMSRGNVEKAAQAIARGIEKFFTGSTTDTGNPDGGNSSLDQPLLSQQGVSYFVDRPQFYTTGNIFTQSAYGSNLVDGYSRTEGNCTWYAHGRVKELGGNSAALNSMSGNANEWHDQISNGTQIVSSPKPGDIAQWTSNGQNHVAVVEAIHPNGTMTISESHYNSDWDGGGAGTLHSVRTIGINEPDRYIRVPGV